MPFFSPKTWKQRIVEFPGRRRLDDTSSADVYDVSRAEGTVTQEGDGFTAANMNDLEQRINNAVNDIAGLSADEYDPNATYSSGDLRIHDNILHKANQDISVAEPWTPAHWDATTIAAELKAQAEDISDLNSRMNTSDVQLTGDSLLKNTVKLSAGVVSGIISFVKNTPGWVDIGTISKKPYAQSDFSLIRNADGLAIGILRFNTNGSIQAYTADTPGDTTASYTYIAES